MSTILTSQWLNYATLSTVQSNIRGAQTFLRDLFFRIPSENLDTESVELSYLEGHEEMAPFVEVNSEAIAVPGNENKFANVSCPNIRIKRPMEAYTAFTKRKPGTPIFPGRRQAARNRRNAIAEDQQTMARMIERREEWMVSRMLTGVDTSYIVLEYQIAEKGNFRVRIPRPANHVIASGANWATPTTPIGDDFFTVKETMAKSRMTPTHVVLGSTAARNFMMNEKVQKELDTSNVNAGNLELQTQFQDSGAIYLGRYRGIQVWSYIAEYIDDATGSSTPHIPATLAIFLNATRSNAAKFFYGAIPDHDAFESGNFIGKRFSKATKTFDPSVYWQLVHTRPMPNIRRPESILVVDTDGAL